MEEVASKPAKRKFDFRDYGTVLGFLCLEVLAFLSFNLGHSFLLFAILSIVLAALLVVVTFRQLKKDGITTYLFFLFPLVIFGILASLNTFIYFSDDGMQVAQSIFAPLALLGIGFSGFLSSYLKQFKIKYALLVVYCALGLFVLINLFITMIYFVPFYPLRYSNYYIYYNGKPLGEPIGSIAYMLYGFKFREVSLTYWSLYPSLLLTAVIPLFFLKFKENKKEFLIYAGLAVLAFISLLFTISKITLLSDAILILGIAIIVIAGKFKGSRPVLNVMMTTIGAILLLVLIVMFVNAQKNWGFTNGIRNIISNNALLNKVFNANRFSYAINIIFQDLFSEYKIFGCPSGYIINGLQNQSEQVLSNMWLFDNLMSSGFFGAIFFLGGLVIGIRRLFKYLNKGKDADYLKFLIAGFVLGFFVITFLLFDNDPLINYSTMMPIYMSAPLLISIFFIGYAFNHTLLLIKEKEPETIKEAEEKPLEEDTSNEEISI